MGFDYVLDHMSDGVWKQVVVNNTDGYIKVIVNVDDDPSRNSYRKQSLTEYSQHPFTTGMYHIQFTQNSPWK